MFSNAIIVLIGEYLNTVAAKFKYISVIQLKQTPVNSNILTADLNDLA